MWLNPAAWCPKPLFKSSVKRCPELRNRQLSRLQEALEAAPSTVLVDPPGQAAHGVLLLARSWSLKVPTGQGAIELRSQPKPGAIWHSESRVCVLFGPVVVPNGHCRRDRRKGTGAGRERRDGTGRGRQHVSTLHHHRVERDAQQEVRVMLMWRVCCSHARALPGSGQQIHNNEHERSCWCLCWVVLSTYLCAAGVGVSSTPRPSRTRHSHAVHHTPPRFCDTGQLRHKAAARGLAAISLVELGTDWVSDRILAGDQVGRAARQVKQQV